MAKAKNKVIPKAKLNAAKKKAAQQLKILKGKYNLAEKKVKTYVHKNPEKAALIAAAIGAAIGAGLAIAMKKKK